MESWLEAQAFAGCDCEVDVRKEWKPLEQRAKLLENQLKYWHLDMTRHSGDYKTKAVVLVCDAVLFTPSSVCFLHLEEMT